jgi:membrane-bound inhibitor of C-type lysozyme
MRYFKTGAYCSAAAMMMALSAPAYASADEIFICGDEGDATLRVLVDPTNGGSAVLEITTGLDSGNSTDLILMEPVIAASGARFAGLGTVFHSKGTTGILETASRTAYCVMEGAETDEDAEENALNIGARSYGGIVRSGPGMEFDRVTSLREGDPVTLLTNTGETMNGYDWFMIMLPNGDIGYQWGGSLCSDELHPPGIFGGREEACPVR